MVETKTGSTNLSSPPIGGAQGASFWQAAWRRLKKNKGAMAGLVMIIIAVLIAIFGYFLSPDPSPFANRIILEIGGEKPGYTRQFLLVKKDRIIEAGFLSQLTSGRPDDVEYIPIATYQQTGDSIIAQKYIDEGVTERIAYAKTALAENHVVEKKFYV